MSEYFDQIVCDDCVDYSVIIEDDGNVCYAYLLFKLSIIADVWLYNQSDTPLETEWKKECMPFLNPIEFVKNEDIIYPITDNTDFEIRFYLIETKLAIREAQIFIRGELVAILMPGSKPGWSTRVKKDGPLAKVYLPKTSI